MKKKQIYPILALVMLSVVSLTSCNFITNSSSSNDLVSSSTTSTTSDTSSNFSTTSSSSTTTTTTTTTTTITTSNPTPPKELVSVSLTLNNDNYYVGQSYNGMLDITIFANYSDNSSVDITQDINNLETYVVDTSDSHQISGMSILHSSGYYNGFISFSYLNENYDFNETFFLKSLLDNERKTITSIEILNYDSNPSIGSVYNKESLDLKIVFDNDTKGYELIKYNDNLSSRLNLVLNLGNGDINLINNPLNASSDTYYLYVEDSITKIKSMAVTFTISGGGFVKLENVSIVASDVDSGYAPSLGDVKILVIPIHLNRGNSSITALSFNNSDLTRLNKLYFGSNLDAQDEDWPFSFKDYYETASFDQMSISGMVSEVYYEDQYTISSVNNDQSMESLYNVFSNALDFVYQSHSDIDWSSYDANNDGYIDNVHFINNAGNGVEWSDVLWPHMSQANIQPTNNRLGINVYSMSQLTSFDDGISTAVHEQGHIFGLMDYYDYTSSSEGGYVDYIGYADMQSGNAFDWNSYSKLSMGWIEPYVIDGTKDSATITLQAASLNGDCLIIPANYETFNGSAFDEYFLIELFSPYNNNEFDWYMWDNQLGSSYSSVDSSFSGLGDYGARMYHVNSTLYELTNAQFMSDWYSYYMYFDEKIKINTKEELLQAYNSPTSYAGLFITNSSNSSDYLGFNVDDPIIEDSKLLTIIQAKNENTFASETSSYYDDHVLDSEDMFQEGDVFTFDEYSHFLSKGDRHNITTMDNGEIFPYEIIFDKMSKESVTITINKVI